MTKPTTPHQAAVQQLQRAGIRLAEMTVYQRDWLDTPERAHVVRVYADGSVTVDGTDIRLPDLKDYWVQACHAHHRATGETARLTRVATLGTARGHTMHVTLGSLGIRDHYALATAVLGRQVNHLRDLTEDEQRRVLHAAHFITSAVAA